MKKNKIPIQVVFTPEKFAQMNTGDIVAYLSTHPNTAIVGECFDVDRHIIKYATKRDWNEYINPYS